MTDALGTDCVAGYYSLGRQTSCIPCPLGYMCPTSTIAPTICLAGFFTDAPAQTSCAACTDGYACPEGSVSATPATSACSQGYYCIGGKDETPCPKGTYGTTTGAATEILGCSACPQGFYCPEGTNGLPSNDMICPRGHFCPAGTGDYKASPCPAGKYTTQLGIVTTTECQDCPAGRFCDAGNADPNCLTCSCPRGHYCPRAITTPTACPDGKYTEEEGATGLEFCKSCPTGHYCPSGTATPTPCPAGTMNPMVEQNSSLSCDACTAAFACTRSGLSKPNYPCSPGYFCPGGNYKPNQTEYACPAGKYTNYNNLTAVEQCEDCPQTTACLVGTGGQQKPPVACSQGHYCKTRTTRPSEHPCPPGSWTNLTNLHSETQCYRCPRGSFCLQGSAAPSGLCNKGHWCPEGQCLILNLFYIISCIFWVIP